MKIQNLKLFYVISVIGLSITMKDSTGFASGSETSQDQFISEKNTLITETRQLTFVGPRSGEGYFSADGKKMIFQSEREPGNPFYQMYVLDLLSGKTQRVSPGQGKTTCGWVHPSGKKVLWSSTHEDPETAAKVKAEYDERKQPVKGRYSWSFDDKFEIYESNLHGKNRRRLTQSPGYDAEASYSPDGKWIAFASNRSMFPGPFADQFSEEEKKILAKDSSFAMEIYIMKSDGSKVKQLTNSPGYDGGPFFSADGKKITWRRFTPDGSKAEIYSMNVDGTEQTQLTNLKSMSWAPFFHPSGKYLIFASSVLGYANFELFIVDAVGLKKPVQVTFASGFDGLASFSPDGDQLTWSHRSERGDSQIYLAKWDHAQALKLLGLEETTPVLANLTDPAISESEIRKAIQFLASERLEGRLTGSAQEQIYTEQLAALFKKLGLKPAVGQSFIQKFEYTSAVSAGTKNSAALKGRLDRELKQGSDYQVMSFSKSGVIPAMPLVFAGYGIQAPAVEKIPAISSYQDLDVNGKWVVLLDGVPMGLEKDLRHHLMSYAMAQHKITVAKNKGAAGVIFISESALKPEIKFDGSLSESSVPVLKISSELAMQLVHSVARVPLTSKVKDFASLRQIYDQVSPMVAGFIFESQYLSASIDLIPQKSIGHNVIGVLNPKKSSLIKSVLVGAHGDHLGRGQQALNSLARADEQNKIHFGADDNASGVSGVIELAAAYSQLDRANKLQRPIYFAVWSGEELGNLGSSHFVKTWQSQTKSDLKQSFEAAFNMDMIGRFRDRLLVQGVGSATEWSSLAEEAALLTGVPLSLTTDPYLPTDAISFYLAGIPSISFFTGSHEEYHSPRDTAETINYSGVVKVISVVDKMLERVTAVAKTGLTYEKVEGNSGQKLEGRQFRIYLGTIPDYSQEGVKGVRVSGTSKNSPAEKAGVKTGDIIVEFDKTKIENLYDYVYALQVAKPDKLTKLAVKRGDQIVELEIKPVLKE